MYFSQSIAAVAVLSTGALAAALPTDLVTRALTSGTPVDCGLIPGNPQLKKRDVHVWQRVNPETTQYRDPAGKVGFHKELNALQDVIGGSHYDVLFGTVGDNNVVYYEVGLQINQEGWVKTHPSGEGAAIDIYRDPGQGVTQAKGKPTRDLQHDDEEELAAQLATLDLESRDVAEEDDEDVEEKRDLDVRAGSTAGKCYYRGVIKAGSTITSPSMAQTKAKAQFGSHTYKVGTLDCTTVTKWILDNITFK